MKTRNIPLLILLCCAGCACKSTISPLSGPRQSLGDIILLQRANTVVVGQVPSEANLTPQDALYSAQMLAVFMEARYGAEKLEGFSHVEVSYRAEDRGQEWHISFNKSPMTPGGFFDIWVDDKTGKGVDYSAGE
jgi:hypothetical protein